MLSLYKSLLALGFVVFVHAAASATFEERFDGEARGPTGKVSYLEKHRVSYEDGRVRRMETDYSDAAGKPIARLVTIFANGPQTPESRFEDFRSGKSEGARVADGKITLWHRNKGSADSEASREFTLGNDALIGQGFHHAVRLRLNELATGKNLHYRLYLPIRLDWYSFKVQKLGGAEAPGQLRLRLASENFLIRMVAPHIETVYETSTGRLVRYEGPSNLEDDTGHRQIVAITYRYETPPPPWPAGVEPPAAAKL